MVNKDCQISVKLPMFFYLIKSCRQALRPDQKVSRCRTSVFVSWKRSWCRCCRNSLHHCHHCLVAEETSSLSWYCTFYTWVQQLPTHRASFCLINKASMHWLNNWLADMLTHWLSKSATLTHWLTDRSTIWLSLTDSQTMPNDAKSAFVWSTAFKVTVQIDLKMIG